MQEGVFSAGFAQAAQISLSQIQVAPWDGWGIIQGKGNTYPLTPSDPPASTYLVLDTLGQHRLPV